MSADERARNGFWRSPSGMVLLVFLAVAGYFLWTEHRPHVIEALPYLLLLVCVGMHVFMHGAHGGHGKGGDHDR